MVEGYRRLLTFALRLRFLVLLIGLGVAGGGYFLFQGLHSELAPVEDRGAIIGFGIAPEGATIDYTDRYGQQMASVFSKVPEMEKVFSVAGYPEVTQAIAILDLVDWDERERTQMAIGRELLPKMLGIPGILAFPLNPPSLGQSPGKKPVQFVIRSTLPYRELEKVVAAFLAEVRQNPNLTNVDSDLKLNKPQIDIDVDRDKVADMGIEVGTIGRTLETMLGGRQVTRFKKGWRAVRRDRQAGRRASAQSERSDAGVRAFGERRHGPVVQHRERVGKRNGEIAEPFRSVAFGHHRRQPGSRLHPGSGPGFHERDGRKGSTRHGAVRLFRRIARVHGIVDQHGVDVRPGVGLHLSLAGGAV